MCTDIRWAVVWWWNMQADILYYGISFLYVRYKDPVEMLILLCRATLWRHCYVTLKAFSAAIRECQEPQWRCTLSVKLSDFTVWRHTWRKNWVNCAVLTGNSAGLRTILTSHLSHRELRSSLRESHSFLSLPADTTMASQGTSVSSNSFSRWASRDVFLFKYHFLLHILRFLFFSSDNIMADVASKQ